MKVYLAGRYSRRDEFTGYAIQLGVESIGVTSRWLREPTSLNHVLDDLGASYKKESSRQDLEDIDAADALVFFAEDENNQPPRGGRHVEFGYALAKRKPIYVVGKPENIFHSLPLVMHYPNFQVVKEVLTKRQRTELSGSTKQYDYTPEYKKHLTQTLPLQGGIDRTAASVIQFGGKSFKSISGPLPDSATERKKYPMFRGLLKYFPDALAEVAHLSYVGNEQHNPGQPLHWAREKSTDQEDTIIRHLLQSGEVDTDGVRHSVKVAWRALALAQLEIEKAKGINGGTKSYGTGGSGG